MPVARAEHSELRDKCREQHQSGGLELAQVHISRKSQAEDHAPPICCITASLHCEGQALL